MKFDLDKLNNSFIISYNVGDAFAELYDINDDIVETEKIKLFSFKEGLDFIRKNNIFLDDVTTKNDNLVNYINTALKS